MDSERVKSLLVLSLPLVLLVLATSIDDAAWSAAFYFAVLLSLLVISVETLRESSHRREENVRLSVELAQAQDQVVRVLGEVQGFQDELQKLRDALASERSAKSRTDSKPRLELMAFIGDTTPMLVELGRTKAPPLDGWLGLVSTRLAKVMGSAAAGLMVLRETLVLEGGEFVLGYEVVCRGGSRGCTLPLGARFRMHEDVSEGLRMEVGVGSVWVVEFGAHQERYWLATLLSSTESDPFVSALCRALVAPVFAALPPPSARPREQVEAAIEPLRPPRGEWSKEQRSE